MSRLAEIKKRAEEGYLSVVGSIEGTEQLEKDLSQLIEQAEQAEKYEETLKYCQFQLKNSGKDKRTRITHAVDQALENND